MPMYGVPISGFQGHSVLKTRDLLVVASEQGEGTTASRAPVENRPAPHLGFLLDITNEPTPWPLATFHVPENPGDFCGRGGRFGAHAGTGVVLSPYYGKLAIFSWFNAGTRVFDIRNPFAVQGGRLFHSRAEQEHHGFLRGRHQPSGRRSQGSRPRAPR